MIKAPNELCKGAKEKMLDEFSYCFRHHGKKTKDQRQRPKTKETMLIRKLSNAPEDGKGDRCVILLRKSSD